MLRLRFGDYSAATRSRTLAPPRPPPRRRSWPRRARLLDEARPAIARRGLTLLGVAVANLDGEPADGQLELPLDGEAAATRSTRRSTPSATASARPRSRGRR